MATCGPPGVSSSGSEVTPEHGVDAEEREEVGGDRRHVDALGLAAVRRGEGAGGADERRARAGGKGVEQLAALLVVAEVSGRDGRQRLVADAEVDPDIGQPVRIPVGQRLHQHAVDDAEDGGGRADAEGEREDGDGGEAGRPRERPNGVLQILQQHVSARPASARRSGCRDSGSR